MKNFTFLKTSFYFLVLVTIFGTFLVSEVKTTKAATNLIQNGSFEGDIEEGWKTWSQVASSSYEFYRSYDSPVGFGSYSIAVEHGEGEEDASTGGLVTRESNNSFTLETGKSYYLSFYVRADSEMTLYSMVSRLEDYQSLYIENFTVNSDWEKHLFVFSSNYTGLCNLNFFFHSLPVDSSLYIDGVQLFESAANVTTDKIDGNIGDRDLRIAVTDIENFSSNDITVSLPYFNPETNTQETRMYQPNRVDARYVYINMERGTFPGVGRVYVNGTQIGEFDYEVEPVLENIYPTQLRVDEDFTLVGAGFSPIQSNTWLVLKAKDNQDAAYEKWMQFENIDSALTQITQGVPFGVVSGNMYVQVSYVDKNGEVQKVKSNSLAYKIKPSIHSSSWSRKGYDQAGDKLTIKGKGISNRPKVNFYNNDGEKIESIKAEVVAVTDFEEVIEVETSEALSEFMITVESGGIESDFEAALTGVAKPVISKIKSSESRTLSYNSTKIQAAEVSEVITIAGSALSSENQATVVEFPGVNDPIEVSLYEEDLDIEGKWLKVKVPYGAVSGHIKIKVGDNVSNTLVLEIIPTILSEMPIVVSPGSEKVLSVAGIGDRIDLTKIHFQFDRQNIITITPRQMEYDGLKTLIYFDVPNNVSNSETMVSVQYGNWSNDGTSYLSAAPQIFRSSIDLDTKILSIKGSGFALSARDNVVTYRYADENQTVINPDVKVLGVFNTEEGQEIRVQIKDSYHYGYVSVTVDGQISNESQFGPVKIHRIARRVELVESIGEVKGVLYLSGHNFGAEGGVLLTQGEDQVWADVHYRTNFFIIAVVDQEYINYNSVIIARQ